MADCDVAVVGAGVVGGSIAYELARRGASVTLLDSRGAGLGATQAAAGMLVPYIEGFGRPILALAARSLGMYDAFIERVARDSGIGVGYQRTGSLQVAMADESPDEVDGRMRDQLFSFPITASSSPPISPRRCLPLPSTMARASARRNASVEFRRTTKAWRCNSRANE
jgi:glycine/D-amino acid oxidase-like deaminating enzyme